MTSNGRTLLFVLSGALVVGGIALQVTEGQGIGLFILAAMVLIGTVFDAGYRGRNRAAHARWEKTGERELDHETGEIVEVWYDPVSGERRYESAGSDPTAS